MYKALLANHHNHVYMQLHTKQLFLMFTLSSLSLVKDMCGTVRGILFWTSGADGIDSPG